jgi:hypothetical protein
VTGVSGPKPQQTGQIKNWEGQVAYREKKQKKTKKKQNKHRRRSPLAFFAGEAFGARNKNGKDIP